MEHPSHKSNVADVTTAGAARYYGVSFTCMHQVALKLYFAYLNNSLSYS